ncbi:MAG: hypothetical protein HY822_08285 [Acidobacteria bacterium]|nr:hypothetical protein [Acidobacteriota bacterium]
MRRALLLFALILPLLAANLKLYLKDGSFHVVREYSVEGDRVRYYSTERGDWEEIPVELADLKRTREEVREVEESRSKVAADITAEEKVERQQREEAARVPGDNGAYLVEGKDLVAVKQAVSKVVTDKKRSVLKYLSPVPFVAGKATVELDGARSSTLATGDSPEFYIRLSAPERFGIAKLTPKKDARVVQKWNIIPVSKEIIDEMEIVEVFRRQVAADVYKIWPVKPLAPGEYAVYQYTEGKGNIQVWDFSLPAKAR